MRGASGRVEVQSELSRSVCGEPYRRTADDSGGMLLLLVPVFAHSFFTLVLGDFRSFSLFPAWHRLPVLWVEKGNSWQPLYLLLSPAVLMAA